MAKTIILLLNGLVIVGMMCCLFWLVWLKLIPKFLKKYSLFKKTEKSYNKTIKNINKKYKE